MRGTGKRGLAMLLAAMMVMSSSAAVFADEPDVDAAGAAVESVEADEAAVEADEAAVEADEASVEADEAAYEADSAAVDPDDSAEPEAAEEEPADAPIMAAAEKIAYDGELLDFIKADGNAFGMFSPQAGSKAEILGNQIKITFYPKNTTVYKGFWFGDISDPDNWTNYQAAEVVMDGETPHYSRYEITLDLTSAGYAWPIAPVKAEDEATTKVQYYLAVPSADKLPNAPEEELAITNNTKMFKAVSAFAAESGGRKYLRMALSADSYRVLYPGTYEEAVANGDNRGNWIHGYQNAEGKWEFLIPLVDGQTNYPIVSISKTYLEKYEKGENPLARAFYPRQFEIDLEARTLIVGDYDNTVELAVTNNVKMFSVADTAELNTVGGPNSNGYKSTLFLTMGSTSFDKVFIGRRDEAAKADEKDIFEIDENKTFAIIVRSIETPGKPETVNSCIGTPTVMSFHSVKKDAWYERQLTIDEKALTLLIEEAPRNYKEIAGANRYATSAALALAAYPEAPEEVIIVKGTDFPDALAANGYAGAVNAPVLLSRLTGVPEEIQKVLKENWGSKVTKATVIGGGFDKKFKDDLAACGITTVTNLSGANRYGTAEAVLKDGMEKKYYTNDVLVIATGQKAADALSISPWTYKKHYPMLLSTSKLVLPESSAKLMKEYGFKKVILLGNVDASCAGGVKDVVRLEGNGRCETSLLIADYFITQLGEGSYQNTAFAMGYNNNYPDALGAGMLQSQLGAPVILARGDDMGKPVFTFCAETLSDKSKYDVFYFIGAAAKGKDKSSYEDLVKAIESKDAQPASTGAR